MERRKRPIMRMALVGGLLASTVASGYWGYRTFTKKPTPPREPIVVTDAVAAADNGIPTPPDSGIPAPPGGTWEGRQLTYDQPADGAANSGIPAPPDLAAPAPVEEGNPYRRRGGTFGATLSDPVETVPQDNGIPEPPAMAIPENNGAVPADIAALPQEINEPTPAQLPELNPQPDPGYANAPEPAPAPIPNEIPEYNPAANVPPPIEANNPPPRPSRANRGVPTLAPQEPTLAPPPANRFDAPDNVGQYNEPPQFNGAGRNARAIAGTSAAIENHQASPVPGDRRLEGTQAPALAMEKAAPVEIQIGKPATFTLRVKNVGQAVARNVVVTDHVPRGTSLAQTRPQAEQSADGSLVWNLGDLAPGSDATIEMVLMPEAEGEIGSVAQVSCQALASTRTVCTRPALVIDHIGPQQVLIGETVSLAITLTNTGTGPATGVVIEEDVPAGLTHVAGRELEYEVGTLKPGETRRMELTLRAAQQGVVENIVQARGDGSLRAEHRARIEVIAPQLQVDVNGPKRRYLERQATYEVNLANPGTAVAKNVDLTAFLPRGMKFIAADSEGQYDPTRHAVHWSLEELPADKRGTVKLTTVPREPGEHVLRVESRGDRNLAASNEQLVVVEAAPELVFSVVDLSDPIEVGSETAYEVRIVNNGTKAASNVQLAVLFPAELQALRGDGPTRSAGDAQRIVFDPVPRLQPREEVAFKVTGRALRAGDIRVRVQLASDEEPNPVTKEESTRIYADQ